MGCEQCRDKACVNANIDNPPGKKICILEGHLARRSDIPRRTPIALERCGIAPVIHKVRQARALPAQPAEPTKYSALRSKELERRQGEKQRTLAKKARRF